jgi:hypothetical protein
MTTGANLSTNVAALLNAKLITELLTREAPWRESHGAEGSYVGAGLLYYTITYTLRADVAVCLGSGGGFVPRLMRQAQRDAGIADRSRTILVDGDVPDGGWGSPQWLAPDSFFRVHYPDVELVLDRTDAAAERVFATQGIRVDYLHIDADHSLEGCLGDFNRYRPFLHRGSLVTLHDTNYPGAGVTYVLECLRARSDCEVLDIVEFGTGTALVRITADSGPAAARSIAPDAASAVEITRRGNSPAVEAPTIQWRYLRSEAFTVRNVLAAHLVRDCDTVVEIGGWHTPIDRYLNGTHTAIIVVDPFIRDSTRYSLNGAPCHVCHVRARFQDLVWTVRRAGEYGLVLLGLDLEGLTTADEEILFSLVRDARRTVIEFPTSWDPSGRQYAAILAGAGVEELLRLRLDLADNDYGDLVNSWPPRVEREIHVLGRRDAAIPAPAQSTDNWLLGHWRGLLAGEEAERSRWRAHGGKWTFRDDGVHARAGGDEWVSLESDFLPSRVGSGPNVVVEVEVSGEAEAAGISFGPYRDLLAPVTGAQPRTVRLELDAEWGSWSLKVDGRHEPRAWWNDGITSAEDLLGGHLTLKARHADDVLFRDLSVRALERQSRLSVVLTCNRFLQRLRLALRAWCEQDVPVGSLEIIVVNPESPDGTREHVATVARAWQHVRVREVLVPGTLSTNKGAMINRGLDVCEGEWVWLADADCLFPPATAREALRQAELAPRHLYFLRRRHLSAGMTDALLAGRLDPVRDFDRLATAAPVAPAEDRAPWGYTQLTPRAALDFVRYREDVNTFAHTDEHFAEDCRRRGYAPRELTGLLCLHLAHPFSWEGTAGFL